MRRFYAGLIVIAVLLLAGLGWALHWNAYTNLLLTLGGFVLAFVWCCGVPEQKP